MNLKRINAILLGGALSLSAVFISCKGTPTDTEIQSEVSKKLSDEAGSAITASVSNGVVTLSGTCKDEECRRECADEAKEVKGVKEVVNNISLTPAAAAPVTITADEPLQEAVNNVVKGYNDVKAEVKDGVVTLRGEINRDRLQELMVALNALNPRKVDNQLKVNN